MAIAVAASALRMQACVQASRREAQRVASAEGLRVRTSVMSVSVNRISAPMLAVMPIQTWSAKQKSR